MLYLRGSDDLYNARYTEGSVYLNLDGIEDYDDDDDDDYDDDDDNDEIDVDEDGDNDANDEGGDYDIRWIALVYFICIQ